MSAVNMSTIAARPSTTAFVQQRLPQTAAVKPAPLRTRSRVVVAAKANQSEERKSSPAQAVVAAVAAGLLSFSGSALADISDILPDSATSQSARDQVNQRLDNAPSVKQVGKNLQDSLDVGSAKDVGKVVDRNTPDVDLTQNPKDLAKQGAEAVDRNTPNLGGLFNKAKSAVKQNTPGDLSRDAKSAAKDAARNTPDLPSASGAGDKLKSQVGSAKSSAKGVTNKVPSPSQLGDKAASAAQSASGDAKSILNKAKNAINKNTPGAIGGNDLESAAKDAARKVDRNTPDLPSASGAGDKLKSQVGSAKSGAKGAFNDVPSASQLGDKASSAAQSASGDAKSILDKAKNAISKNTPGAIGAAKDVGAGAVTLDEKLKSKGAAFDVQGAFKDVPNPSQPGDKAVTDLPNTSQLVNKLKNQVGSADPKGAFKDLPNSSQLGDKASSAAQSASSDGKSILDKAKSVISNNTPGAIGGNDLKSAAKDAARKVDRNTPDLPSASGAGDKLKSQVGSAKSGAKGAFNDVPSASQLGDKASSAAQSASGDAKSILDKAKNAISKNTPGAIGGAKVQDVGAGAVTLDEKLKSKGAAFDVQGAFKDVPNPSRPGDKAITDLPNTSQLGDKLKNQVGSADPKGAFKDLPNPSQLGDKASSAAQSASGDGKSFLDKAKSVISNNTPGAIGGGDATRAASNVADDVQKKTQEFFDKANELSDKAQQNVKQGTQGVSGKANLLDAFENNVGSAQAQAKGAVQEGKQKLGL